MAELMFEDLSGIAVDVEDAGDAGSTAQSKAAGHATLAITNAAGPTMAREASVSFPTEAGFERAIPATKSLTAQLLNLYLLSLLAAESRRAIDATELHARLRELSDLPARISRQLPE